MIKPCAKQVLIRRTEPVTKTAGGLYIPDIYQQKNARTDGCVTGTVVAVGPRVADEAPENQVVPEMLVAFGKFCGADLQLHGVDHVMVHLDEILGECTA